MRALVAATLVLTATAPRAEDATARAACEQVLPAAAASKVLGRNVTVEGMMSIGLVVMCGYQDGGMPVVTLQLSPKITKAQYQELYVASARGKSKPLPGVGDEAFTASQAAPGGGTSTSACGRKRDVAFCVSQGVVPGADVVAVAKALVAKL